MRRIFNLNLIRRIFGASIMIYYAVAIGSFFLARWGFSSSTFAPIFQSFGTTLGVQPSLLTDWLMPLMYTTMFLLFFYKTVSFSSFTVKRYRMWNAFGERLKEAYAAKFNGENSAFNEEVDTLIKIMRTLGKGYTKKIAENRLKALSSFAEIPYVIPEEEYQSEAVKTVQFGKEHDS